MAILKALNAALSFFLEIAMLAAFGSWGYHAVANPWLRWLLAIGVPLVVMILWGLFLAPRAGQRARSTLGIPITLGLFYLAAGAFYLTNQPSLGTAMLVLAALNRLLVVIWKQW